MILKSKQKKKYNEYKKYSFKKPKKESNKGMLSYQILKYSRRQQWKEWVAETGHSVHQNINSRNRSKYM